MGRAVVEVNFHELTEFLKEGSEFRVKRGLPKDAVVESCTLEGITYRLLVSSSNYPEVPEGSDLPIHDIELDEFTRRRSY